MVPCMDIGGRLHPGNNAVGARRIAEIVPLIGIISLPEFVETNIKNRIKINSFTVKIFTKNNIYG
jgi:hypothetical protein